MRSPFDMRREAPVAASSQGDNLPTACPACRSASILTTAKKPNADSYWRCKDCGEVWNAARSQPSHRGMATWR